MDLQIKPHQTPVSDALQSYIDRKVGRLDRYLDRVTEAKLELREDHHRTGGIRHIAQLTIATGFAVLRAGISDSTARRKTLSLALSNSAAGYSLLCSLSNSSENRFSSIVTWPAVQLLGGFAESRKEFAYSRAECRYVGEALAEMLANDQISVLSELRMFATSNGFT